MSIPYKGTLIPLAKNLRKNATRQENKLWYDFLKNYPIRFQRQKTIRNYIVDFYCHSLKLVIEIDGSQHYTEAGIEYDKMREYFLEKNGIRIIRFSNFDIDRNFNGVCTYIDEICKSSKASISEGGGWCKTDGGR